MYVYSKSISSFLQRVSQIAGKILNEETPYLFKRKRLLYNNYFYPLSFACFESEKDLGHFCSSTYLIGLNKALSYQAKNSVLFDIMRHELAHYLCFLEYGETESPHGPEFQRICDQLSWPKSVSGASLNLKEANNLIEGDLQTEKLITKVDKLFRLAKSPNIHEANSALLKANELIQKHNLSFLEHETKDHGHEFYMERVLQFKRISAKYRAISEIISHFHVAPVLSSGQGTSFLEVTGERHNVKVANYLAKLLDRSLDQMWKEHKKANNLQGLRAKNSFFIGVARGYSQKREKERERPESSPHQNALIKLKNRLQEQVSVVYGRLGHSSSFSHLDDQAYRQGQESGHKLNFQSALDHQKSSRNLLLTVPKGLS